MNIVENGISAIPGYTYSAIECNIRYKDRLDYALISHSSLCNAAGVFTQNKIAAAPVKLCKARIDQPIKAILINATNANACTGDLGITNAENLTKDIAEKLHVDAPAVLMASTGIIGHQLPTQLMLESHDTLITQLNQNNASKVADAILTTDTHPKELCVSFETSTGLYHLGGFAKGSGMIAPNMATLLSFLLTDAPINKKTLNEIFKNVINQTLNCITIDGDTSTNDTAIILSPISENYLHNKKDIEAFEEALFFILNRLAEMLVKDGEGVTKSVKIIVQNAPTIDEAKTIAKSVSESLLVKTAIFGKDPNWGRIAMAVGNADANIKEEKLSISIGNVPLLVNGTPVSYNTITMHEFLEKDEYSITIDVSNGTETATIITSDLSYGYVKINAEYST